jgi:undecaprenyl diphosphate synthase
MTPKHIAIIMDGNRRWAKAHHLPELMGHKRVSDDILEPLIEHGAKLGIQYMTFWAWSTENWKRKEEEVKGIMEIFRHVIRNNWKRLAEKGVRIQIIGDISKFPKDIEESLKNVVEETKSNTRITTIFALNYGGRDEILRAMNKAISYQLSAIKSNKKNIIVGSDDWKLTTDDFTQFLDTKDIPDPELIIRTGGEQRLSGFLLWQCQYSELYFPSFFMPDFTPEKLDEAIAEYQKRKRRFGV